MKALSIMGIVMLHSIFIQEGTDNELSTILRLVAIKVLLFLSGWVVYGKVTKKGWVLEKIVRRIPLLLIFTGVYFLFGTFIAGIDGGDKLNVSIFTWYNYNLATGFIGLVIWYVWVLMLCYVLIWLFEKYIANFTRIPYLVKFGVLAFAIIWIPFDYFGFSFVRWYGLFMFLGYALKYAYDNYDKFRIFSSKLIYIPAILFPFIIWVVGDILTFKGQWASSTGYVNILNAVQVGESKYILIFSLITLSGIAFTYVVAKLLTLNKYIIKPFLFIGSSTIGILLLHKIFLEVGWFDNYILAFIVSLILSLSIYQLLKRIKILDYLLFGGTDIPIKISNKLEGWYGKAKS